MTDTQEVEDRIHAFLVGELVELEEDFFHELSRAPIGVSEGVIREGLADVNPKLIQWALSRLRYKRRVEMIYDPSEERAGFNGRWWFPLSPHGSHR